MRARNRYVQIPDEPRYEKDVDAQVERLREVLRLMTPESGSAALGALRRAAPDMPLRERVKALGVSRA